MASTISVLAALPLQPTNGGKLLLSTTTPPPSPPATPTPTPASASTAATTTPTPTAHPVSASPPRREDNKAKRLSCTTNRAPFRSHSICTLAPNLLACCGDNMRGGLSAPGGGRDSEVVSRAGTPLPRFLGELRLSPCHSTPPQNADWLLYRQLRQRRKPRRRREAGRNTDAGAQGQPHALDPVARRVGQLHLRGEPDGRDSDLVN